MANLPLKVIQNSQKQMPCNIEAEQALIGSILVSNEIYDEIALIINKTQKLYTEQIFCGKNNAKI